MPRCSSRDIRASKHFIFVNRLFGLYALLMQSNHGSILGGRDILLEALSPRWLGVLSEYSIHLSVKRLSALWRLLCPVDGALYPRFSANRISIPT